MKNNSLLLSRKGKSTQILFDPDGYKKYFNSIKILRSTVPSQNVLTIAEFTRFVAKMFASQLLSESGEMTAADCVWE